MSAILESVVFRRDSLSVCLGNGNLNRLVSLFEIMEEFRVDSLSYILAELVAGESTISQHRKTRGDFTADAERLVAIAPILSEAEVVCRAIGFVESLETVEIAKAWFHEKNKQRTGSAIENELRHIRHAIVKELQKRKFISVLPDRVHLFKQPHLFGEPVHQAFPSARYDIEEAGNCLAIEANTAAVFHLMRVAEHGLRALAYDRRVKIPKGKVIDLATWEEIIRQLEVAEHAISGYPKTNAREAQFVFYHGAMMEVRAFKNVWRNRYMHTRASLEEWYDRDKAHSALVHVGEFISILATRITEGKRTPVIWKRA